MEKLIKGVKYEIYHSCGYGSRIESRFFVRKSEGYIPYYLTDKGEWEENPKYTFKTVREAIQKIRSTLK